MSINDNAGLQNTTTQTADEEDITARIERLGRQRPEKFATFWQEMGFCISLLTSIMMAEYFISGFNLILPTLATALEIPEASQTWPASAFTLVTGAFLLPFGRLADMYGGYPVFIFGLAWFFLWSLIAGFSVNAIMLDFCRALQGLGPAAFLPSGIMLMGSIYRPGPRKNLVFSVYGACAPVGFFGGIFIAGLSGQFLKWGWYFWIGSILLGMVTVMAILTVPSDMAEKKGNKIKMDWWGVATIVPGLILIVFAITDSAHAPQGWRTPYVYVTIIVGALFLGAAFYVEGWVASMPLLPFDLFKVPQMTPLVIALFFSYGVFGIYLLYASIYIQSVLGAGPLLTTAWYAPMATGGLVLSLTGGLLLHLLPGTVLLVISGIGYTVSVLLFAIIPSSPNYWAYVFPAMLCATLGIDITYNVTNIFITTSMPQSRQGLAGALINSTLFLGISFFLGFADIAATGTAHLGMKQSYKVVFWFAVACSVIPLVLIVLFIRINKAKSELTADEKAELHREVTRIMSRESAMSGRARREPVALKPVEEEEEKKRTL